MGATPDPATIRLRLGELRAWADGYVEVNETAARRLGSFLYDVGYLVEAYEIERDARVAAQGNYERALGVILSRGYRDYLEAQLATA